MFPWIMWGLNKISLVDFIGIMLMCGVVEWKPFLAELKPYYAYSKLVSCVIETFNFLHGTQVLIVFSALERRHKIA